MQNLEIETGAAGKGMGMLTTQRRRLCRCGFLGEELSPFFRVFSTCHSPLLPSTLRRNSQTFTLTLQAQGDPGPASPQLRLDHFSNVYFHPSLPEPPSAPEATQPAQSSGVHTKLVGLQVSRVEPLKSQVWAWLSGSAPSVSPPSGASGLRRPHPIRLTAEVSEGGFL